MKYENVVYENVDLIEITDKRFMKLENKVHATGFLKVTNK